MKRFLISFYYTPYEEDRTETELENMFDDDLTDFYYKHGEIENLTVEEYEWANKKVLPLPHKQD